MLLHVLIMHDAKHDDHEKTEKLRGSHLNYSLFKWKQ